MHCIFCLGSHNNCIEQCCLCSHLTGRKTELQEDKLAWELALSSLGPLTLMTYLLHPAANSSVTVSYPPPCCDQITDKSNLKNYFS